MRSAAIFAPPVGSVCGDTSRRAKIVAEILVAMHALGPRHPGELTLVFMGMGEPLHNFEHVARAVQVLADALRDQLMPINRRYPLEMLVAALERYPLRPRERITIEYVLLAGVNDGPDDAARLAELSAGFPHQINLIPFNTRSGSRYRSPTDAELDAFASAVLARRPTILTVRRSRGRDIDGACGQLIASLA